MDKGSVARPVVGEPLHLVVLRDPDVEIVSATLKFDRGRGLVVETVNVPPMKLRRGDRVMIAFAAGEALYAMRGHVGEILTNTRFYILPNSHPVMMEKREYIRAVVPLVSALAAGKDPPGPSLRLEPARVELSASGFRWFGPLQVAPGDPVWLCMRLAGGGGGRTDVQATVVRAGMVGGTYEVAGHFESLRTDVREQLLDLVFRSRLAELGIHAGRTWDEDA